MINRRANRIISFVMGGVYVENIKLIFLTVVLLAGMASFCHAVKFLFRFDMGAQNSPLRAGYTIITRDDI